MHLVPVPSTLVDQHWQEVEGYVQKACKRGPLDGTPDEYKTNCERGFNQLWLVRHPNTNTCGAIVTGISSGVLEGLIVAGDDMPEWIHLLSQIEDWAREQGCSKVRAYTRKGMTKRMTTYSTRGIIIEKVL